MSALLSVLWRSALLAAVLTGSVQAGDFSFSEYEENEAAEEASAAQSRARYIDQLLSTPCKQRLQGKKVAIVIAERHDNGRYSTRQSNYGLMFQEINNRLRRLGMRTFTPEQITAQIAQAEVEAFFNDDPDAAISAARRLGASFTIRGLISARSRVNRVVGINEVFVDMGLTLVDSRGRTLADASASGDSWAGSDTVSVALHLVREQADQMVAELYHGYCS